MWEDLPSELLVKMFVKVGTKSLLLSLPFVCRSWNVASKDPACWQNLLLPDDDEPFVHTTLDVMCSNPDYIEEYNPDSENDRFEHFIRRCATKFHIDRTHLSSLKFINGVIDISRGNAQFLKLPAYCRDSEFSDLLFDNVWYMEEILEHITKHCSGFCSLQISLAVFFKSSVLTLIRYLPSIRSLSLRYLRISREDLVLLLGGCKHLHYLDLSHCNAFDENDEEILELVSEVETFICHGARAEPEVFSEMEESGDDEESDDESDDEDSDDESDDEESDDED